MRVYEVEFRVCEGCLRGDGEECHTPGCAYWMCDTPPQERRVFLATHVRHIAWTDEQCIATEQIVKDGPLHQCTLHRGHSGKHQL